jgi:hypothetical protein
MTIPRHRALQLLTKCLGDEIWSVEHCRQSGIPDLWIEEMSDAFESGFQNDSQTIYVEREVTNQYHGVRDLDLAIRLSRSLGVDVDRILSTTPGQRAIVRALKEALMDGE